MKKILFIIFTILIFIIGGILGYKKIASDEREKQIIQFFDKKILTSFVENKKSVVERLKISSKEEANKIYNEYLETNHLIIGSINKEHSNLITNVYNEDSEYKLTEKEWKIANSFLKDYDLELIATSEGDAMIREVPNFYYNIFKDYVTDDYREYLEIISQENEEPYYEDGSLLVSYDKITDRLLVWENFLKKYPNSDLGEKANFECNIYRMIYILGSDNAPTREGGWKNNELFYIPENNLKEFNRFIEKYPDSPTVELIKFYLENYKNTNIDIMLNEKIDKEFYLGASENREKGNLFSRESNILLEEFKENKKDVINKLKSSTKNEANEIYENYLKTNTKIKDNINKIEAQMLSTSFYQDGNLEHKYIEKEKLNKQNNFLDSYGLELVEKDTGFILVEKKNFYYELFKNYLTDDYREFLKLDSEEPYYTSYSDYLNEKIEKIAEQVVIWENFLQKYPDSKLKRVVNNNYLLYRRDYIIRLTSDSTREVLLSEKSNEAIKELNRFINKYPNSPTTEIIKYYLENYRNENINTIILEKLK